MSVFVPSNLPGEMAQRIRELDWSATPLGHLEGWPQGLRLSTATILAVMPGEIDGLALARRIKEEYPDVAVLLTTGYARAINTLDAGFPVLRKPYQLPALAGAIREALDAQTSLLLT